jgi:hypothetical protein
MVSISKVDSAKLQLETAIRLYFSDGDPVSIHALTAASYNILRDVTEQMGADPIFIKGQMLEMVKPEYKKMFIDKVNEAENFFKHADRDRQATLEFNPDMTDLHMIDACAQYRKLTGHEPLLFTVYRVWFMAHHPDFFVLPDELTTILRANADSITDMRRAEYFETMLAAMGLGGT